MSCEHFPTAPDSDKSWWMKLNWQKTPYEGVELCLLHREIDPKNSDVPLFTIMAMKLEPKSIVPLHIHKRDDETPAWSEALDFLHGGKFKIYWKNSTQDILEPVTTSVASRQAIGIENLDDKSLVFTSTMIKGFTDYREIETL